MKKLFTSIIVTIMALCSFAPVTSAQKNGIEVGINVTKSVTGSLADDEPDYMSFGAEIAYRADVLKLFYIRPELGLNFMRYPYDVTDGFGVRHKSNTPFNIEAELDLGIKIWNGFSFFTGPVVRYTTMGKNAYYKEFRNTWSAYWAFGLRKDIYRFYISASYCQGLNHYDEMVGGTDDKPSRRNRFSFSLGFRF